MFVALTYGFTSSLRLNALICVICFCWLLVSSISIWKLIKINLFLAFVTLFFFVSIISFAKQSEGVYAASTHYQAMTLASKTIGFAYLGMLFSLTTKNIDLLYSLQQQLHVPNVFVYGIFAALNLFKDIQMQLAKNQVAFRSRGQKFAKYSIKSVTALLIKTIYFADFVTIAMQSKRFNAEVKRNGYYQKKIGVRDYFFILVNICFVVLMLLVKS